MSAEIEYLAWIAGKAGLLYATAIIGLRLGKRRILAELRSTLSPLWRSGRSRQNSKRF